MSSKSEEEWRPFDTGNVVIPGYEVSSLGKVRNIKTGEILDVSNEPKNSGVSPHLCVCNSWWRPDILVSFVFRQRIEPIKPIAPPVIEPVIKRVVIPVTLPLVESDETITETFKPKTEYKSRKNRQQNRVHERAQIAPVVASVVEPVSAPSIEPEPVEGESVSIEAEPQSPEFELAQMLYKPYMYEHQPGVSPAHTQTPQDHAAQKVSAKRDQPVHGVAKVLRLYRMSAHKRGHAWELTDEKAIALMVSACRYCGCNPGTHNHNGLNGIDRVDSAKGYIESNVVPCCGKCNMMKGTRTPDEFLGHVVSIVEYQRDSQVFV